jgi:hypothetical protein
MIILGFDTAIINWYLVLYVLSSIFFLVYGTNAVYPTGQVRAVIFAIGTALVLLYFGLKWFGTPKSTVTEWPPAINMCPDYLTYIPSLGDSKPGCVDMLGVSTNGSFKQTMPSDLPPTGQLKSIANTATDLNKVFASATKSYTSVDIKTAIATSDKETITAICNLCQTNGLTWEGVYDGATCIGLNKFNSAQGALRKCLISI